MRPLLLMLAAACFAHAADDPTARLQMARQIAREKNDRDLVTRIEKLAANEPADAQIRDIEAALGIDPGGWAMAGQPLFHPTPVIEAALKASGPKLAAAMAAADAQAVREITSEMLQVLGDQAGLPDGRSMGVEAPEFTITEPQAVKLFLDALGSEGRVVRQLMAGEPLKDQMLRLYAYVMEGCVTMHPFVARHAPQRLGDLEKLLRGTAGLLVRLQQPAGYFPFPDLRGKNIRFGEMIERQVQNGVAKVQDGWVTTPDADGGSQFDAGVCGVALLKAGRLLNDETFLAAGQRAADWAASQKCCANFNYNAFSVSLLAQSGRRDAALEKFRLGVAPGQAANGRWLDPHNARTVYHVIILRALGDLGRSEEVDAVTRPAIRALLDEFDAMGITVEALPELLKLARQFPEDIRLQQAVRDMAASLVAKCTDGKRVKLGAQPHQLSAVVDVVGSF